MRIWRVCMNYRISAHNVRPMGSSGTSALKRSTPVDAENWTNIIRHISEAARQEVGYYYSHIGSRIQDFD